MPTIYEHRLKSEGNTLVYNERISGMPVKLVYCFENDRLRTEIRFLTMAITSFLWSATGSNPKEI